ncbi:MAG: zinc-binding dehydrogenase, partial [Promethearchaeota archaeon]
EFVRVPHVNIEKKGVYVLDDTVRYEQAVFIEPLGCVCRAQRLARISKEQTCLILGSGVSGLLHLKLIKAKGVKTIIITDISEYRLEQAKKLGATLALKATEDIKAKIKEVNEDRMPDCIIVCTGALPAAKQALDCVGPGSTIVFFAVPPPGVNLEIPINDYWRNEITIMTSYGASPVDLDESYEWIKSKRVEVEDLISHRFPLEKAQEAFKVVCEADQSMKVILEP